MFVRALAPGPPCCSFSRDFSTVASVEMDEALKLHCQIIQSAVLE